MRRKRSVRLAWAWLAVGTMCLAGCEDLLNLKIDRTRFLSPDKVIKAPKHPSVSPILPSLSPADPAVEILPNAEQPRAEDWTYTDEDYVIGPTDIVDVSVLDLFGDGLETVLRREVSAGGYIDLPLLKGRIEAGGRSQRRLTQSIRKAYIDDEILREPIVSVTIAARRQNMFSILGAIGRPGRYGITRRDMRLLDALALAGDITQTNIRYLYVIRPAPAIRKSARERGAPSSRQAPKPPGKGELPLPELLKLDDKKDSKDKPKGDKPAGPTSSPPPKGVESDSSAKRRSVPAEAKQPAPATAEALGELREFMSGPDRQSRTTPVPATAAGGSRLAPPSRGDKFGYIDGEWVRVSAEAAATGLLAAAPGGETTTRLPTRREAGGPQSKPATLPAGAATKPADPYGWKKYDRSTLGRLIVIDLTKLKNGDPRMNVVVRNNDIIHVPPLEVGEFYVMGEVARPGVYSLTGRRITVKQALAAAGNLGPMAWPENSALIRRLGRDQEQIVPLNVEAICRGDEPDVFLKPDDLLAIGTDVRAPFMAVFRNAFRMTYGFGFIYDRNFAETVVGSLDSKRFRRW